MRAVIGTSHGASEIRLPLVGFFAALERALTGADWLATLREDGTPNQIWGDANKALEHLGK